MGLEAILALFARAGYARVEPPVLQPAGVFVELSGESIRRRLFVTADAEGREWALRPEYTIPVARVWLARGEGTPAAFAYGGPVFRASSGGDGEFVQAGVESFGRTDAEAADAEILSIALEALAAGGLARPALRLGDVGLFNAVLDGLRLPAATARRLRGAFAAGTLGADTLAGFAPAEDGGGHAGLLVALQGQDPKAARAFVEDVLTIAGIARVGGRTAAEIAERFLDRAARDAGRLPDEARGVLERYVAVEGDPDAASAALRALGREAGLKLDAALDAFDLRTGFMAARGVDVGSLRFSARFGRNLDYYTGFVFEAYAPGVPEPVAGGGRYDRLLGLLGAPAPAPAVGCAIWAGRLGGGGAP